MCFATLSYLSTHICTNLLTQCTQCQFLSADVCELQVYTHIYNAQKIPTKIYTKSAFQKTPDPRRRAGGAPSVTQGTRGRSHPAGRARWPPGWCGPPLVP